MDEEEDEEMREEEVESAHARRRGAAIAGAQCSRGASWPAHLSATTPALESVGLGWTACAHSEREGEGIGRERLSEEEGGRRRCRGERLRKKMVVEADMWAS